MKSKHKLVSRWPVQNIWNDEGIVSTKNLRSLGDHDIETLLKQSMVHFAIFNLGLKPQWLELEECYEFWRNEVKPNLCSEKEEGCDLSDFPNGYMYFASEWESSSSYPIVVLSVYH